MGAGFPGWEQATLPCTTLVYPARYYTLLYTTVYLVPGTNTVCMTAQRCLRGRSEPLPALGPGDPGRLIYLSGK